MSRCQPMIIYHKYIYISVRKDIYIYLCYVAHLRSVAHSCLSAACNTVRGRWAVVGAWENSITDLVQFGRHPIWHAMCLRFLSDFILLCRFQPAKVFRLLFVLLCGLCNTITHTISKKGPKRNVSVLVYLFFCFCSLNID